MFGRREVRVFEEIDGVVYDSDTADIIHYWDSFGGRNIIATTPEGRYFLARIYESFFTPRFWVLPIGRRYAIELAAKNDAPDKAMEELGVKILNPVESDEPYNIVSSETIWPHRTLFGWRTLLRNYDGRLWMFKSFDILGIQTHWASPISQRQAIAWAIRKGAWSEYLAMLGVEGDLYTN